MLPNVGFDIIEECSSRESTSIDLILVVLSHISRNCFAFPDSASFGPSRNLAVYLKSSTLVEESGLKNAH